MVWTGIVTSYAPYRMNLRNEVQRCGRGLTSYAAHRTAVDTECFVGHEAAKEPSGSANASANPVEEHLRVCRRAQIVWLSV